MNKIPSIIDILKQFESLRKSVKEHKYLRAQQQELLETNRMIKRQFEIKYRRHFKK